MLLRRPRDAIADSRTYIWLFCLASNFVTYFLTSHSRSCSATASFAGSELARCPATEGHTGVSTASAHISINKLNQLSTNRSSVATTEPILDHLEGSDKALFPNTPAAISAENPNQSWLPALEYDRTLPPYLPIFMAFQFNFELLKQTLMSYKVAHVHNIIVLDNSLGKHAIQDAVNLKSSYGVAQVIEMPFSLYFTELQNLMAFMARQSQIPFYYWSHMDVMALPHSEHPEDSMGLRMSECAEQVLRNNDSWGVLFNSNDNLCANRLEAFDSCGGYDTYVTTYTADCDFYARMRDKGYITVDCDVGYIFDATINNASVTEAMNAPFDQVSWDAKYKLMKDMSWRKSQSREGWREADFTEADRAAWWPLNKMGETYYNRKFNGKHCDAPAKGNMQFDRVAVPTAQVQAKNQDLLDKYNLLYTGDASSIAW